MKKLIVVLMVVIFFAVAVNEANAGGRRRQGHSGGGNAWKPVAVLGGVLIAITALDRAFGYNGVSSYPATVAYQPYQPQLMNCYGSVNEDVWGVDRYGNRYVQYTQQRRVQIPCP